VAGVREGATYLLASRPGSCGKAERKMEIVRAGIAHLLASKPGSCNKDERAMEAATESSVALTIKATLPAAIRPCCLRVAVLGSEDPMLFARKISIRARAKEDIGYTAGGFVNPTTGDFSRFGPLGRSSR